MEEQMNAPELRFPEFSDFWEDKKLEEVSDVRDGTHDSPKYVIKGFPFITSKNLLEDGSIDFKNVTYITELDYKKISQRSKVNINDILFGMIGTIGNPVLLKSDCFAIKNVALIKEINELKNIFLIHYLKGENINQQFFEQNTGGTQKFLSLTSIRNLLIKLPSIKEQQKIASFLTTIDEKIQVLQKKMNLLEQYKKGVMQKLFSQELRFKDDEGKEFSDWVEKKLGEVSDVRDGTHDSPIYVNDGFPFITSKNLLSNGTIDFDNLTFITEADYKKFNQRSKVNINDILFGMIGTIGNPVLVKSDGFAIKNVALIKELKDLKNLFLIHFLRSEAINQQFFEQNTGGTQKFLALGVIRNLRIQLPSVQEQTKIANFLSSIDDKISGGETQITQTLIWKKGLLQKMFV